MTENGIHAINASEVEIENSTFSKCVKPAIALNNYAKLKIRSSKFYNLYANGIIARSGSEIEIIECQFLDIVGCSSVCAEEIDSSVTIKDCEILDEEIYLVNGANLIRL